jgi:hypothetical protein
VVCCLSTLYLGNGIKDMDYLFFSMSTKKNIFRKIRMLKKCVLQRIPKRNIFAVKHTKKIFF